MIILAERRARRVHVNGPVSCGRSHCHPRCASGGTGHIGRQQVDSPETHYTACTECCGTSRSHDRDHRRGRGRSGRWRICRPASQLRASLAGVEPAGVQSGAGRVPVRRQRPVLQIELFKRSPGQRPVQLPRLGHDCLRSADEMSGPSSRAHASTAERFQTLCPCAAPRKASGNLRSRAIWLTRCRVRPSIAAIS